MSTFIINQSATLSGSALIPSSKSHTLRAILFAALARGESTVRNVLDSPDAEAMIRAAEMLGAQIERQYHDLKITGVAGKPSIPDDVIDSGNSGQVLRFVGAIAGLLDGATVITGDHSVRHNRPVLPLLSALNQLGAEAFSTRGDDKAPIVIRGPMKAGKITMDGQDSQPVSGMLIAAQGLSGTTQINVENVGEKPWLSLTLDWFKRLNLPYTASDDLSCFEISGPNVIEAFDYFVPGDFSSLAFPVAAAILMRSEVTIEGVDMNDVQGDKALLKALETMGAQFDYDDHQKSLRVKVVENLKGADLDINDYIDAITILAVVATQAEGETVIRNASIARMKECNRIASICSELKKMGADIEETEDGLRVRRSDLSGARVQSYHDHRMAMSLAVAGLVAQGETVIESVDCVRKTFPNFASLMQSLGANIVVKA